MPEWYVLVILLGGLAALGLAWPPLLLLLPIFAAAVMLSFVQAAIAAATAQFRSHPPLRRFAARILVAQLHLLQPLARLLGRVRHGLGPWGWTGASLGPVRLMHEREIWSEKWQSVEARLTEIQSASPSRRCSSDQGWRFLSLGPLC